MKGSHCKCKHNRVNFFDFLDFFATGSIAVQRGGSSTLPDKLATSSVEPKASSNRPTVHPLCNYTYPMMTAMVALGMLLEVTVMVLMAVFNVHPMIRGVEFLTPTYSWLLMQLRLKV